MSSLKDSPGIFIGLMAVGFLIGAGGHVYRNSFAVGLGIFIIFAATLLLPALVYFTD